MNLALVLAVTVSGTAGSMDYTTETGWLVYPVALTAGTLLGCVNAFAIITFRLSPLIVTLATLSLYRGVRPLVLDLSRGRRFHAPVAEGAGSGVQPLSRPREDGAAARAGGAASWTASRSSGSIWGVSSP